MTTQVEGCLAEDVQIFGTLADGAVITSKLSEVINASFDSAYDSGTAALFGYSKLTDNTLTAHNVWNVDVSGTVIVTMKGRL